MIKLIAMEVTLKMTTQDFVKLIQEIEELDTDYGVRRNSVLRQIWEAGVPDEDSD